MTRRVVSTTLLLYGAFILFMIWYIFKIDSSIPDMYKGTMADPATFLSNRELMLSEEYSKIRNFLFFLSTPFEWILYFFILVLGLSAKMKHWAQAITKFPLFNIPIYLFWLSLFVTVLSFPLSYTSFYFSKKYQITTQSFSSWMRDEVVDYWVNFGIMMIMMVVLYWIIRKSEKRWWLYSWLLSVPFTLFLTFVQPVLIDPLYNDFYPLKDKVLEAKILSLADQADIPANHVYEVNMSEKTNTMNAYVTGIGANSRIVLWDTTLNKLSDDEVLFIMAHEMGHYVKKHIYLSVVGSTLLSLVGLFLVSKVMNVLIRNYGHVLKIDSIRSISSLPLLLLLISLLSFAISPATNAISRYHEKESDEYGLMLTQNNEAAVRTFQELTRASLSQVNPPFLVKQFRYTHPTILERIHYLENFQKEK